MKKDIKDFFNSIQTIDLFQSELKRGFANSNIIFTSSLPGSSFCLLANYLNATEKQLILLVDSPKDVQELMVELNVTGLADSTVIIDDFNIENLQEKLTDISNRQNFIIVSTFKLLLQKLPSKDALTKNTTIIEVGSDLTYDDLVEYLNFSEYSKDKYVENPGDYSTRGSIIDFWSYSERQPCRLEFDGDFLESIRYFNPESQRSSIRIPNITLAAKVNGESTDQELSTIFSYLKNPVILASEFELNALFNKDSKTNIKNTQDDIDQDLKEEIFSGTDADSSVNRNEVLSEKTNISLQNLFDEKARWIIQQEIGEAENKYLFGLTDTPPINSNFDLLSKALLNFAGKDYKIIITAENEMQVKRLADLLSELNENIRLLIESGKISIIDFAIKKGFVSKQENLVVLTDYEIFNKPFRTKISGKHKLKKSKARDLASLKIGDYVVHENFGIGKYSGLETINIGMTEQESIKILYAEGDVVYVNLNYLGLITKFSSNEEIKPSLTHLGSNEWRSTKKKVKAKIKDAARQLIILYAKRKAEQGYAFSADTIWQKELEASFMYEDTNDQSKVTDEVKVDMESSTPMDRLVCGDVGFGKTEIAVRAAFKAVTNNKQVALMVPTTILAEQHFNTFKDRLSQFPVRVEALSRFSSKREQTDTVQRLSEGKVDIVIGTHRLLSKDIQFRDLGLLIIDEEHRFGVMAKEKLKSIKENVDTLTLTATPIPRTLNMSLLGARDLSIIATPPPNRIPIVTKVETFDIIKIREWITHELLRNGQIYFVHDRVQSIDKIAAYIKRHIPELKITVAHGQMKPNQLEKVIHDFLAKKFDMLIATKIIESGLDIPNVNTIIINRADRFGLAELHQLRGRVGRSNRQAFAYLLVPSMDTITKKAVRRLHAIEEYTDLGEGFNLSMRDLEIRGAGNLLGTEQSGAINTVGFDMYVKLLDEAVDELRQGEFKNEFKDLPKAADRSSPTIDSYFEIGIPKDYMPDQADRLSFYTALFSIIRIDEIDEITDEMKDRYGKFPEIINRLILAAKLRFNASIALFERIVIKKDQVIIILPKGDREEFYTTKFSVLMKFIMEKYSKEIFFKQGKEAMKLEMRNKFSSPESILDYLIKFCEQVIKLLHDSNAK
ncbi:MAG: transcription-repair coupling factor [Ignavibacteriae bacterium HGW-Ignavibacteriae-2]|nr:MAG: transcription-repair coupling factor [Ignavibacteriae bacterium HGW-Ignavibacteriae-2]